MNYKSFVGIIFAGILFLLSAMESPEITTAINQACQDAGITQTPLMLGKTSAMTTYTNSTFNFQYTAPSGWSFNTPQVGVSGVMILATSPSYPASVLICVFDRGTYYAAQDYAKGDCFATSVIAYKSGTSTTAPLLYSVVDTFFGDVGAEWLKVKYGGTSFPNLGATYNQYNSHFVIAVTYFTTTADHSLNDNNYFLNVLGAKFISLYPSTLAKSSTVPTVTAPLIVGKNSAIISSNIQRNFNLFLYDLMGRRALLYDGTTSGLLKLGNRESSNTYILQLHSNQDQYVVKMLDTK